MTSSLQPPTSNPQPRTSWLGSPVLRNEDARFLSGHGQYVDDIALPGMLHAAMLRSPHAHALVKRVDYSRALEVPGVHGVITGQDVVGVIEPEKGATYPHGGSWYFMATDRARFVGEVIAVVAAADRYIAEDALDAIEVEYEPLPVVSDSERATEPDQPELHPGAPGGNEVLNRVWEFGDVETAFADADMVVSQRFVVHRRSATPLECLGAIASYDHSNGQVTIWACVGNATKHTALSRILKLSHSDIRLIVPDIGGSFGVKALVHQKAALLTVLSRKVGRPVKWIEDRVEHLMASHHATPRIARVEMAAKRDGVITGVKMRLIDDQGAYTPPNEPMGATIAIGDLSGCYTFRNIRIESRCVVTNKCPIFPVRGYGRVEYFFPLERTVDRLARKLGMDPAEVRTKNLLSADDFPYTTPSKSVYESGDPHALLRQVEQALDYDGLRGEQAQARHGGRLLGIGLCAASEHSGPKPRNIERDFGVKDSKVRSTVDVASVRLAPDGVLHALTPTLCQGQGHETTVAQIVADQLGVDPSRVRVSVRLDTASMPYTPFSGTYGSRFVTTAGPAVHGAARKLRDQLSVLAGSLLEADPSDIDFRDGKALVAGAPARSVTMRELAATAHTAPESFGLGSDVGLQATFRWTSPNSDPVANSAAQMCHGALVEVDAETGKVQVLKYVAAEECGRILNPLIVEGLTKGGVAHGLAWSLTESFVYDQAGQLLTNTFMDYLPIRFTDMPGLELAHVECPVPSSPLGAKGMAEGAAIPPPACIANAVEDAIAHLGGVITDSHLTPERVLRAIRSRSPGL